MLHSTTFVKEVKSVSMGHLEDATELRRYHSWPAGALSYKFYVCDCTWACLSPETRRYRSTYKVFFFFPGK